MSLLGHVTTYLLLSFGSSLALNCSDGFCSADSASGLHLLQVKAKLTSDTTHLQPPVHQYRSPGAHPQLEDIHVGNRSTPGPTFDCAARPEYCGPPLNCQEPHIRHGFSTANNGHADLKLWCYQAWSFENYRSGVVDQCLINHDLSAAATATYLFQADPDYGSATIGELDGSYCFIQGFCRLDTITVTNDTTIAEAEAMCDDKYGHESWTTQSVFDGTAPTLAERFITGQTLKSSDYYGRDACARGNFHCDVVYCRETWCKVPHFIETYGHLLTELPWDHSGSNFVEKYKHLVVPS